MHESSTGAPSQVQGQVIRSARGSQLRSITTRFVAAVIVLCSLHGVAEADPRVAALISQAGNAAAETERLESLRELAALDGLPGPLREQAESLIQAIERWNNDPYLGYFGGEVLKTDDFDFGIPEDSPLHPLTLLYRGRMLIWTVLEFGGYGGPEQFAKARARFETYTATFPDNPVARMYLGQPIPASRHYEAPAEAPAWAAYQREALERLADIIAWWIEHRQREDGQYGGGWGDDCEMWRWWAPVLLGFEDPRINAAQARFSEAIMAQEHMRGGYTSHLYDVEHTAEDSSDAITPMMHLAPEDPRWSQRALRIVDLMEERWTGVNERGQLQFKSTYFAADRTDDAPERACDTVYHPWVVQPALLYWQRTRDERLTRLFSRWMDTWVDAAARAERGKPAGIVPSAIHWPDGSVGGLGPDWWDPQNHKESALYQWPSAMSSLLNMMLLTWHITREERYLAPVRSMAAARLRHLDALSREEAAPGLEAWCAAKLEFLSGVLGKHRLLTGDPEFEALLCRDASPYLAFRLSGDRERLTEALGRTRAALSMNFEGYTSEVRYTDRVLRFPTLFGEGRMPLAPGAGMALPDTQLLYSCITGDPGDPGYFPLNAVRWSMPPRDFAALVIEATERRFAAEVYHFKKGPQMVSARFFLLAPGRYRVRVTDITNLTNGAEKRVVIASETSVGFEIMGQRPCRVELLSVGAQP